MTETERDLFEALKALLAANSAMSTARTANDAVWMAATNAKLLAIQRGKALVERLERQA